MTYLKLVPTLAAAIFIGGALTANAEGTVAEKFASMDVDSNGSVNAAEFVTYVTSSGKHSAAEAQAKFAELAGDDGALSLEELEAAYAEKEPAEGEPTESEASVAEPAEAVSVEAHQGTGAGS